jgi:hypothetical protein
MLHSQQTVQAQADHICNITTMGKIWNFAQNKHMALQLSSFTPQRDDQRLAVSKQNAW